MLITPTDVFVDGTREKDVFLEHHGYLITEHFQVVVSYIDPANFDCTAGDIVKSRDHLNQCGFGTSCSTDDSDCLSGFNMKVYIFQRKISALSGIAEVYMVKNDIAARDFSDCIRSVLHLRHFIKNLCDTICRSLCDHDHDKYKSYHIQRHQDLQCIDDHTCQLTCLHGSKHNTASTDHSDQKNDCIHHKLHGRRIPCNDLFSLCEQGINVFGYPMEFIYLIIFSYKSFHYTGSVDVFLNGIVQLIVLVKYFDKMRMCFFCNVHQCAAENRDHDQEQKCDLDIDQKCHDPG